jgi:hypothetical protein
MPTLFLVGLGISLAPTLALSIFFQKNSIFLIFKEMLMRGVPLMCFLAFVLLKKK